MRHLLIIILFFLTSCTNSFTDKQKVNKNDVSYIEIRKQFDSIPFRLTDIQVSDFIDNWNQSNSQGPHKYLTEYPLIIHFKGDSSLYYRTNQNLIKQRSDWAYSIGDKSYFKNIWFQQAGLTDNYFEYHPIYFADDKFTTDTNPLNEKHCKAIKQVLTFYNHKWIKVHGLIFYQGKIDEETLWNYTTKANDSIWLSSHL